MKKKIAAALAVGLVIVCAIGGTLAYFASQETGTNTFLIGEVHIKTTEPLYPAIDKDGDGIPETPNTDEDENGVPDENDKMTPYKEAAKNPTITNTGKNDCIVFMKVTIPAENITLIKDDSTRSTLGLHDIFWLKQGSLDNEGTGVNDGDNITEHKNHFDENWILISKYSSSGTDEDVTDTNKYKPIVATNVPCNDEKKGFEYVFAYKTRLVEKESTTALFDKVQNKKYGSSQIGPEEIEQILIDSYAIQADCIYQNGTVMDTTGELTEEQATYIYETYCNQWNTRDKSAETQGNPGSESNTGSDATEASSN